jgi:hypothetical protein
MGLHKRGRTGSAEHKRAHKGAHRGAQWAQRERTAHIFPNFFAFQAREMKFDEQILVALGHLKFSVAHGHFKFPVAHSHFKKISLSFSFEYSCTRQWIFQKNEV